MGDAEVGEDCGANMLGIIRTEAPVVNTCFLARFSASAPWAGADAARTIDAGKYGSRPWRVGRTRPMAAGVYRRPEVRRKAQVLADRIFIAGRSGHRAEVGGPQTFALTCPLARRRESRRVKGGRDDVQAGA
jgi:hypothetical protein